jgi:hypothetical protein
MKTKIIILLRQQYMSKPSFPRRGCVTIGKMSFRTNVRNLNVLILLVIKISPGACPEHNDKIPRSARNDRVRRGRNDNKMNYDTVSKAEIQNGPGCRIKRLCHNYVFVIPCKRSATLSLPRIPASARTGPIRGNPVYIHGSPLSRGRRLDTGACPGPRSGIRRHDGLAGAFYYYDTVSKSGMTIDMFNCHSNNM